MQAVLELGSIMTSVLQPWVHEAPWKCQSILLSGLRGPDHANVPYVKAVCRWMRRVSQNNADPTTDYMRSDALPSTTVVEAELEFLPCHFVHHFADALRIIAIWHPDHATGEYAERLHIFIAEETFHFRPESTVAFINRHADKVPT